MSAEIINLRQARKAKQRRDADALAEENRAKFGRSKAERKVTQAERDLEARRLEAQRRERGGNDDEPAK
jgi:hypothetical protein